MRNIDQFLQTVTDHVEMDRAARSLHTPLHGHRVDAVEEISDRGEYVVVANGKFKKLDYDKLFERHATKLRDNKKRSEDADIRKQPKPVEPSRLQVPGRIRNAVLEVTPIYVFSNGDEMEPPKRVILTRRMMSHWALILAEINQHVQPQYSSVQYLCTLEGERVVHKASIRAGEYYVAVGYRTPFRKLNYGQRLFKPPFNTSPRVPLRNLTTGGIQNRKPRASVLSEDETFNESGSLPALSTQSDPGTQKRRKRRGYNIVYSDGKPVFPMRPVRPYRHQEPLPAIQDHDKDENGVFKSNTNRSETRDARQVEDNVDTQTELPVDMRKAEEVEDDLQEDRGTQITYRHSDKQQQQQQKQQLREQDSDNSSAFRRTPIPKDRRVIVADDDDDIVERYRREEMAKETKSVDASQDVKPMDEGDDAPRQSPIPESSLSEKKSSADKATQDAETGTGGLESGRQDEDRKSPLAEAPADEEDSSAGKVTQDAETGAESLESGRQDDARESPSVDSSRRDKENNQVEQIEEEKASTATKYQNEAATKIQAAFRGHQVRKQRKSAPINEAN